MSKIGACWSVFALFVLASASAAPAQDKGAVKLETVKYDAFKEAILKQRGKVIYVDFWFLGCQPCKDALPHLVDLYAKRHKEGLEVITVNINVQELPAEKNHKESLDFLRSKKAVFRNVILDEGEDIWVKRLRIADFPSIYVFDRQGRWTQFRAPIDHKAVAALVDKLLREPLK
jgi:thiol-disulfide isomerase/thioredoxin